jgi:hypothetical protein
MPTWLSEVERAYRSPQSPTREAVVQTPADALLIYSASRDSSVVEHLIVDQEAGVRYPLPVPVGRSSVSSGSGFPPQLTRKIQR